MKILEKDLRKGYIKLLPEDQDDLWILYNIIKPGDLVTGLTSRDIKHEEGGSSRRIPMILTIRVKTLEFQPFTERLRIRGIVVEGPERFGVKGHHHTINVEPGTVIVLQKEYWAKNYLDMITKASSKKYKILLIALDYDEAAIALLSEQGLKILEEISSNVTGKRDPRSFEKKLREYFDELAKKIIYYVEKNDPSIVVIASPGDLQRRLYSLISSYLKTKKINIIVDSVSMGGISGIRELLRRDSVREAVKEVSVIKARGVLEEFYRRLVKEPERIAYGLDHVEFAVKMNAVEKLVVLDKFLRTFDENIRKRIDKVLDEAYKRGAEIIIVPYNTDTGIEIDGLGGIIALLRYSLPTNIVKGEEK